MSATPSIRTEALAASAGTGKTFALSSRYIGLLAAGAEPAAIVALTFTRKAAGEILARILKRLAEGARDDAGHTKLSKELAEGGLPAFPDPGTARTALRAMIQALPVLRIGTLDSFFVQILQQFRLEVGLGTDPAITDTRPDAQEDPILQRLLEQAHMTDQQKSELFQAFKLATFGDEKKTVYAAIHALVENQLELYRRAPFPEAWGHPERIWGTPNPWNPPAPDLDWEPLIQILRDTVHPRAEKAWSAFLEFLAVAAASENADFGSPKLSSEIYSAFSAPGRTAESILYNREEISFSADVQDALQQMMSDFRRRLFDRQMRQTAGLFLLLARYAEARHGHILQTGQIAFSDIAPLLTPADDGLPRNLRLRIDYRLDARFKHWLLDEFQDTSLIQWQVLENLLDEVIQNPDGERTLFYVGDTKQAIYEWRSGDPRLFRRILGKYNRPGQPKAIEDGRCLVQSWRSSPYVLKAVNEVFGNLPGLPVPKAVAEDWEEISQRWNDEWNNHEAAPKNKDLAGTVSVHILPRVKRGEDGPSPSDAAVGWIQHLQKEIPHFSEYSVGILTRKNSEALDIHQALEACGIRSDLAGNEVLTDNVLIPAIVSLANLIEHPADTLARRHIEMSPLHPQLKLTPGSLAMHARRIREQGYAGWLTHLAPTLKLPDEAVFEQTRLRQLISLCGDFDRQPGATALRFEAFVDSLSRPASHTGSNIEVLTIHKAKGLEYDIVLLPSLKGNHGITSGGSGTQDLMVLERPGDDPIPPVDWILSPPRNFAKKADPVLSEQFAHDRQNGALESLRLLYVAMTRAKRALHIFTAQPSERSDTLYLENLVQAALASGKNADPETPAVILGKDRWWESDQKKPPEATPFPLHPLELSALPAKQAEPQLGSKTASEIHAPPPLPSGRHFRAGGAAARELGTRVHEAFEQIEWLDAGEIPEFPEATDEERDLIRVCLSRPEAHVFFEKPEDGRAELLREQAFEAVIDGQWLSGKIDRLHLERDAAGKPVRALVIDYKTDQTPDPDRHRPQMEDYRRAAALLFGLPPRDIACTLLFVRTGDAVKL